MLAITYHEYGTADVLRRTELDRPEPRPGEVLVRVRAASINHADLFTLHGAPRVGRLAFGLRRPRATVLGRAASGTVAAVGAGVDDLKAGDDVFGELTAGCFAEFVAGPAARLVRKPDAVTFEQAATLPIAATTALLAVRAADAGPGRTLLVNGASGGVGTFTVQLARMLGARVTGVCSARNADLVRSLGADRVIDYAREDVTRGTDRFDAVIDLAGGHRVSAMRRILTPRGVYVASTGNGGPVLGPMPRVFTVLATGPFVRHRLRNLVVRHSAADLAEVAALVERGAVTPAIEATYPLSEAADAVRRLERDHARGKIVLSP
ncbi:NAD(P)-dependent alcohol dehydrogenase [Amorphoplanes digitatis]|uniref:NADPH:quinone reductase-like Zn-dependent oxidoreductase n=1 Tax=Actinoplanes digitatis TaxID=1868 RepID=A0A7W7HXW4_9ACTN|nr:NAD(P)-dependent alcohol dehydrogenase [Actinoplanes digitatis]MBB4762790.1 NADPH:quinone reductase-like Zn-dependent oxidoreductase [Actinoplanes digitatis]BFE71712.1 NAD(P)-dependent alcohol dehydrogenase [Actinoplanes digitatis]GID91714.1 NADPH:quinone reductase [Actinoplanes digitatis]